jgi:hypothetical protein
VNTTDQLDAWWRQLGSAVLVGTARRPVPASPAWGIEPRPEARPEEHALDAAALAAVLRQAGARPRHDVPLPEQAPPDTHPEAPRRAVQLLELVLTQPPGGTDSAAPLLSHWLQACDAAGARLPHRLLPQVLDRAVTHELRRRLAPVLDERGRWLAAQNPAWTWAVTSVAEVIRAEVVPDEWAQLPAVERAATLAELRLNDPAGGRQLLLTTWGSDSAKDRRAHLDALRIGLGRDDEDLLESSLDDRAAAVRELAADLLDALPDSRRGERMAARLRPLIHEAGLLRKTIEVDLPDQPDAAGVRDGLGKAPAGRSARGWWLERIVAAAPFEVWPGEAGHVVARLHDMDALAGLRQAALRRGDVLWARALLQHSFDVSLLSVLPRADREEVVRDRLRVAKSLPDVAAMLSTLPGGWSPQLSAAVIDRITHDKQQLLHLGYVLPLLADGLHPDAIPALQRWRERTPDLSSQVDRAVGRLIQTHSIHRTITEAFQ